MYMQLTYAQETKEAKDGKRIKKEVKRERMDISDDDSDDGVELVKRPPKKRGVIPRGEEHVIELSDDE